MKEFLMTALAAALGQIVIYLLVQGFEMSYWGKNSRQEITRWFNSLSKHYKKMQANNDFNKDL